MAARAGERVDDAAYCRRVGDVELLGDHVITREFRRLARVAPPVGEAHPRPTRDEHPDYLGAIPPVPPTTMAVPGSVLKSPMSSYSRRGGGAGQVLEYRYAGIQLPWKPYGTRRGSWIRATGLPAKSEASRITRSLPSRAAS